MKRAVVFFSALALALGQAASLAAHPRNVAPARQAIAAPQPGVRDGSPVQSDFKVPSSHVVVLPLRSNLPLPGLPYHRFGWQSAPSFLWYPSLLGTGCTAADSLFGSPGEQQQPADFTLGSLVDGKSNLLTSPHYDSAFAGTNNSDTQSAGGVTFQAGFSQAPCGTSPFTNF